MKAPGPVYGRVLPCMSDQFTITVPFKGSDLQFEVTPVITTYTYRFMVTVNETNIIFERDEEGGFRAMKAPDHMHHDLKEQDIALLYVIQKELEQLFG